MVYSFIHREYDIFHLMFLLRKVGILLYCMGYLLVFLMFRIVSLVFCKYCSYCTVTSMVSDRIFMIKLYYFGWKATVIVK